MKDFSSFANEYFKLLTTLAGGTGILILMGVEFSKLNSKIKLLEQKIKTTEEKIITTEEKIKTSQSDAVIRAVSKILAVLRV